MRGPYRCQADNGGVRSRERGRGPLAEPAARQWHVIRVGEGSIQAERRDRHDAWASRIGRSAADLVELSAPEVGQD